MAIISHCFSFVMRVLLDRTFVSHETNVDELAQK
jgi:hypothetical protein